MRYTPLDTEVAMLDEMTSAERMHYATTRMVESEEVWSIGNDAGWAIDEVDEQAFIRIWPYRQFAQEYGVGESEELVPQATSLENFVYSVLNMCDDGDIKLEVFPMDGMQGLIVSPNELYELLNGMLETGEYFVEG